MMQRALFALLVVVAGCVRAGAFVCQSDQDCVFAGTQGVCEPTAFCSFPDPACADGQRYGEHAGPYAGRCATGGDDGDGGIGDGRDGNGDSNGDVDAAPPAVVLFVDTFESGTLSAWVLSGPGAPWAASNIAPFTGASAARVVPSSITDPASVMAHAVATTGHTQISVSYVRRLIGLDAADAFRSQWFDGSTWMPLEATSTSVDDPAYVGKMFQLPSGADNNPLLQIRFECTAGAVSESCNVDNVTVGAGT